MANLFPENNSNIRSLDTVEAGKWNNMTLSQLQNLATSLSFPRTGETLTTSIPTFWARMILFKDAITPDERNEYTHPFFKQAIKEIFALLHFIVYEKSHEKRITIEPIYLSDNRDFIPAIRELKPKEITDEYLIIKYGDDIIGGYSPWTGIFTSATQNDQLRSYINNFNDNMYDWSDEFKYVINELNEFFRVEKNNNWKNFYDLIDHYTRGTDNWPRSINVNIDLFDKFELLDFKFKVLKSKHIKSNYYLINDYDKKAIIISQKTYDSSKDIVLGKKWPKYDWEKIKSKNRNVIPDLDLKVKWIYPEIDFFEEKIIELPLNAERILYPKFVDSNLESPTNYLLPLKKEFFNYFKKGNFESKIKITDFGNITFELELEIGKDQTSKQKITFKKIYDRQKDLIKILKPHFTIFPNFVSDDLGKYYLFLFSPSQKVDDLGDFKFYKCGESDGIRVLGTNQNKRENNALVYEIESCPDIFEYYSKEGIRGIIITDFDKKSLDERKAIVAIDFGTSNTTIAYKEESQDQERKFGKLLQLTENLIHHFNHQKVEEDVAALSFLTKYFFPLKFRIYDNSFSPQVDAENPIHTTYLYNKSSSVEAIMLDGNIPFYDLSDIQRGERKFLQDNLKWGTDALIKKLVDLYLNEIVYFCKCVLFSEGFKLKNLSWRWSYPEAFDAEKKGVYASNWKKILGFEPKSLDESTSTLYYFQTKYPDKVASESNDVSVSVDIGGATTDIAVYRKGEEIARNSLMFAGRDLVGWQIPDNPYGEKFQLVVGKIINILQEFEKETDDPNIAKIIENYPLMSQYSILCGHKLFLAECTSIIGKLPELKFATIYFLGALLYYIGHFIKSLKIDKVRNIMFAGNGSQFIKWCSAFQHFNEISFRNESKLLKSFLQFAMDQNEDEDFNILFSQEPKHEVSLGLTKGGTEIREANNLVRVPITCEKVKVNEKEFDEYSLLQPNDCKVTEGSDLTFYNNNINKFNEFYITKLENQNIIQPSNFISPDFKNFFMAEDVTSAFIYNDDGYRRDLKGTTSYLNTPIFLIEARYYLRRILQYKH